jgi:two-component system CheB/CheR fusion protein
MRKALVVDDYTDAAETLALFLTSYGYDARFVTEAREASQAVTDHGPNVVFLDIRMPDIDGFGVAKQLRSRAALDEVVLIAYTSEAWSDIRERAIDAGFDGYVRKASEPETLLTLLENLDEAEPGTG